MYHLLPQYYVQGIRSYPDIYLRDIFTIFTSVCLSIYQPIYLLIYHLSQYIRERKKVKNDRLLMSDLLTIKNLSKEIKLFWVRNSCGEQFCIFSKSCLIDSTHNCFSLPPPLSLPPIKATTPTFYLVLNLLVNTYNILDISIQEVNNKRTKYYRESHIKI